MNHLAALSASERNILQKLRSPIRIQEYLDTLPVNFEEDGETLMSPRRTLQTQKAHCIEGALLAAAALWLNGEKPLLLDLTADDTDYDHVIALYKFKGFWGAISKSNHVALRFRDPIYRTLRELALSYFHEYADEKTGRKTLVSYSKPYDLRIFKEEWLTSEDDLWELSDTLDSLPHYALVPKHAKQTIRPLDAIERKAGALTEWKQKPTKALSSRGKADKRKAKGR